jgi:hypothetical protein
VDRSSSGRVRRVRRYGWLVAVGVFLATPGTAAAHSTAPTVALDFHLRLSSATRALPGVRASLVDGDRGLRLRVDPGETLIVRGDLGEPLIRFDGRGVWVNTKSLTAVADRLVRSSSVSGVAWSLRSQEHTFRWHEHRLAPPPSLRTGHTAPWFIPILLNGRPRSIGGTFARVPAPHPLLWALVALVLVAAVAAAARWAPRVRPRLVVALGALAAAGALASACSFALADEISGAGEWVEVGAVGLLLVLSAYAVARRRHGWRVWIGAAMGIVCVSFSLETAGVFLHGYLISTLPAVLTRVAVLLAIVAGAATAVLSIVVEYDVGRTTSARRSQIRTQPLPRPRPRSR